MYDSPHVTHSWQDGAYWPTRLIPNTFLTGLQFLVVQPTVWKWSSTANRCLQLCLCLFCTDSNLSCRSLWLPCRQQGGSWPFLGMELDEPNRMVRRRTGKGVLGEAAHADVQMLKLSPQPHVPLMLGLLNTNSLDSFVSTKSISVPNKVSWAFFSMKTLTPEKDSTNTLKAEQGSRAAFMVILLRLSCGNQGHS